MEGRGHTWTFVLLCAALLIACTSPQTAAGPSELGEPSAPTLNAEQQRELEQLERKRDRLFAATFARGPTSGLDRRLVSFVLAEALLRTNSHDAARSLGHLVARPRYRAKAERHAVSANGRWAATFELEPTGESNCVGARMSSFEIHDLAAGRKVVGPLRGSPMGAAALSRDGERLAISDGELVRVHASEDGRVLFEAMHSPCMDDPEFPAAELEFVWHPQARALAAFRSYLRTQLVVWNPEGEVLLREMIDEQQSERLRTPEGQAQLWRRVGLAPEAAPEAPHRFVGHDDVYEVFEASAASEDPLAVFGVSTRILAVHPVEGHPKLAVVELPDTLAVIDWTYEGMLESVCRSFETGLSQQEWAELLPHWSWRSRCKAAGDESQAKHEGLSNFAARKQALEDELREHWHALFGLSLGDLAKSKAREEQVMLVQLHALAHMRSSEIEAELAELVAQRPTARPLPSAGKVKRVLPHPDGQRLAFVLDDGRVERHTTPEAPGEVLTTLDDEALEHLQWAGDELAYLTLSSESGKAYAELHRLGARSGDPQRFDLGKARVDDLVAALSPDGRHLVVASGIKGARLMIWDTQSGSRIPSETIRQKRRCTCCCGEPCACPKNAFVRLYFSDDSRYLGVEAHQELPVFELATGKRLRDAGVDNPDGVLDVKFSSDNKWVLSLVSWRFGGTDVLKVALAGDAEAEMLTYDEPWPEGAGYSGAHIVVRELPYWEDAPPPEDKSEPRTAALFVERQIVLASASTIEDELRVDDPALPTGAYIVLGPNRAGRVEADRSLTPLHDLPVGEQPILSGDAMSLFSHDEEQGRVSHWAMPEFSVEQLSASEEALREGVCASVNRDLSLAEWRRLIGDVPFTPRCGPDE